jgi:guanidinopropionase
MPADSFGDVVEVAPPFDPFGGTALVGATLMFEMLCLFAEAIAKRSATNKPDTQTAALRS